jgi:hypothetical protein
MKFIKIFSIILFASFILLIGCSDSPINNNNTQSETLLYQRIGLIDSLVGTCSAYLVRTSILDSIDARNYNSLRAEFQAYTDGDLSNITFFYLDSGITYNLFTLDGTNQINNTITYFIPSPKIKDNLYLRLRLFASACTGQYYHLKLRDFKIYGIN